MSDKKEYEDEDQETTVTRFEYSVDILCCYAGAGGIPFLSHPMAA